jgi:hypothetical protein
MPIAAARTIAPIGNHDRREGGGDENAIAAIDAEEIVGVGPGHGGSDCSA